jgi:hypothetical protein
MRKWKAAKVSWASLREASEKIALLVKTWEDHQLELNEGRVKGGVVYNAYCCQGVDDHPDQARDEWALRSWLFPVLFLRKELIVFMVTDSVGVMGQPLLLLVIAPMANCEESGLDI